MSGDGMSLGDASGNVMSLFGEVRSCLLCGDVIGSLPQQHSEGSNLHFTRAFSFFVCHEFLIGIRGITPLPAEGIEKAGAGSSQEEEQLLPPSPPAIVP